MFKGVTAVYKLAIPILLTTVFSVLSVLVNTKILGEVNNDYLYILAIYVPVSIYIVALLESFQAAGFAFSGMAQGSGDLKRLAKRFSVTLVAITIFCLITWLCFMLLQDVFFLALNVELVHQAEIGDFVSLALLSSILVLSSTMLGSMCYVFGSGFRVTLCSALANCCGFFITWYCANHLALGTSSLIISQVVSSSICLLSFAVMLRRKKLSWLSKIGFSDFRETYGIAANIVIPVFLSFMVFIVQAGVISHILSEYSATLVSAYGIAYRLQNLLILPAVAIGISIAIKVNEFRGRDEEEKANELIRNCIKSVLLMYSVFAIGVFFTNSYFVSLLTNDIGVATAAAEFFNYVSPSYLVFGPLVSFLIMQEQIGKGKRALCFNLFATAIQLLLIYAAHHFYQNPQIIYLTIAIGSVLAGIYVLVQLPSKQHECIDLHKPSTIRIN
ncbi:MATE family efflux transporter [Pseudoalteromonas sp. S16_S37]|uniref:MATE family efflux transporter n=1 Tax=Pseudoalteromonas sp. S16_S37 TaxID=2720228 RepID=UPI0016809CCB|nr:MATE family efflux transporter [Pseudoalteromonas sp. S16_S37]MBD1584441.1 hypothetical protein [Pseudoalteromonas sp. S16_S37]